MRLLMNDDKALGYRVQRKRPYVATAAVFGPYTKHAPMDLPDRIVLLGALVAFAILVVTLLIDIMGLR